MIGCPRTPGAPMLLVAEPILRRRAADTIRPRGRRRSPCPSRQAPQLLAQQMPRREMKRHAAVEIFVAQDPADARRPRQHAKGRRIGHDGEVGRAGHLGQAHAAAARERREGAGVGGIERRGRDVDVVAGRRARRGTPAPSPPWRARRRADRPRPGERIAGSPARTRSLSSSACRRWSSVQRPCFSMKDCVVITPRANAGIGAHCGRSNPPLIN